MEVVDQFLDANRVRSGQLIGPHQVVAHLAVAGGIHVHGKRTQRMIGNTLKGIVGDRFKAIAGDSRSTSFVNREVRSRRLPPELQLLQFQLPCG